ncbi:AtpZ/AtpI family protein [Sulfuricurvum sp.]|uniref:AtpZ/AtpI family protein n=1 Tax=Sulfuricurvum sp. TaxID=2025608 RepID=UPI0025EB2928|nr:AtpZ/AtpI family protein [Sulfuricurvum sp.]
MENQEEHKPRIKPIIEGAESLSLGISMVVAILIGVAIGLGLKKVTGIAWLLWIGVAIGIAAAVMNVYKAYSKQYKEFEKLAKDPRYNMGKQQKDDDDDDEE